MKFDKKALTINRTVIINLENVTVGAKIMYQVNVEEIGWMNWFENGQV